MWWVHAAWAQMQNDASQAQVKAGDEADAIDRPATRWLTGAIGKLTVGAAERVCDAKRAEAHSNVCRAHGSQAPHAFPTHSAS